MVLCQRLYNIYENLITGNMNEEKTKDQIKNPNFYSGSTFIGDWTGAYAGSGGWGIKDYNAYFGTDQTKETINNFKESNIYKELANPNKKHI